MSIATRTIDYGPEVRITNLDALPRGTGARYLIVLESPYAGVYVAKACTWRRPRTLKRCEWLVRLAS